MISAVGFMELIIPLCVCPYWANIGSATTAYQLQCEMDDYKLAMP